MIEGGKRAYPYGHQQSILLCYMGNVPANMCDPTIDRFKVSVKNMYAPVDVGDENANGGRGNTRYLEGSLEEQPFKVQQKRRLAGTYLEYIRRTVKVMGVFNGYDVEEGKLAPLYHIVRTALSSRTEFEKDTYEGSREEGK